MSRPSTVEAREARLAADLAEILRFAGRNPDPGFMAELLLKCFDEGRYAGPRAPLREDQWLRDLIFNWITASGYTWSSGFDQLLDAIEAHLFGSPGSAPTNEPNKETT